MKKTLLALALVAGLSFGASAQCTPDTTHFTGSTKVYPDSLPVITTGQFYSEVVSIQIPDSVLASDFVPNAPGTAYIDSVKIDAISGEPSGITSASTPALGSWILAGRYACATFSGTTSAAAQEYPLTITGTGCGHFFAPAQLGGGRYDSCIANTNLTNFFPYHLRVAYATGIQEILAGVDMNVFPNPNQGSFTVNISAQDRLNGNVIVMDALGRAIHTEAIDVTGTKQLPLDLGNVSSGVYMLVINTANGKAVRQFTVK
ncbi:MAG: T9SS type A sorting domain-containing protein [Bacteroidetes bacterium]|nr:T9SS type A sorting domain-containing protein [Bacteroidota bacterium]